jgi:ABC-type phosphate transport system permease subunit
MKGQRYTLKAYTTALLTLLVGIALSINQHDWGWFARSGSLVVINGIILTSHHIIQHMRSLNQSQARPELKFERDWAKADKQNLFHEYSQDIWTNEKYGLYMLIAGTLVWGFGDLINQFN